MARPRDCGARTGGSRYGAKTAGSPTANRSTIPTLELLDTSDHAGAHRLVQQQPGSGGPVFPPLIDPGGRWEGAGHRLCGEDELWNDVRPLCAADLRCQAGHRVALKLSEQLAFAKRPINDHADAAVPR